MCNNEWIAVATDVGLREINIDCSLRFRVRDEERSRLLDAECASFSECLQRFQEIESPKHSEIFGPSPFGGSGDQRHAKPSSRYQGHDQLNSNLNVNSDTMNGTDSKWMLSSSNNKTIQFHSQFPV